jgi:hypothetical protein
MSKEDELEKELKVEKEPNSSILLMDFITCSVPEVSDVHVRSVDEYTQEKEAIIKSYLHDENKIYHTRTSNLPYDTLALVNQKVDFQEKLDNNKLVKQRGARLLCLTRLRLLGIKNPSIFIDSVLSQPNLFSHKNEDGPNGNQIYGIDYKNIVNFAKNIRQCTKNPTLLTNRLNELGVSETFLSIDERVFDQYKLIDGIPDELFVAAIAYLKSLPWLTYTHCHDESFLQELTSRVKFVSSFKETSLSDKVCLNIQEILYILDLEVIDNLSSVLDNQEVLEDLLAVAKELHIEKKTLGQMKKHMAPQLEGLYKQPEKLTNIANSIRNGKRFEVDGITNSFENGTWGDQENYENLTSEPLLFTKGQTQLADAMDLHSFETHYTVLELEELVKETVFKNMDMLLKEAMVTLLVNKNASNVSIGLAFEKLRITDHENIAAKWRKFDSKIHMGKRDSGSPANAGHDLDYQSRSVVLKRILVRTLLLKDEKTIDSDLISYLMHMTDIVPMENYLDKETIAMLPKNDKHMVKLLQKIDPNSSSNLWEFIVDNKDNLSSYLDNSGNITEHFVDLFLSYKYSSDISFTELIPLFNDTNLPNDFIDHSNKVVFISRKIHIDYKIHVANLFKLFISFDNDHEKRNIEVAKYWEGRSQELFISSLSKQTFKRIMGDKDSDSFLLALPKDKDQRRNAFLHNDYDRVSTWLINMTNKTIKDGFEYVENAGHGLYGVEGMGFTLREDIEVATEFIHKFGLADNPKLFVIFKALHLSKTDELFEIPEEIASLGLKSKEDLHEQYSSVQSFLIDTKPLMDTSKFTEFQLMLLSSVTGRDTHTFKRKDTIQDIGNRFSSQVLEGKIPPLSPEHSVANLSFSDVEITYNPSDLVVNKFGLIIKISNEIFESLGNGNYWETIVKEFGIELKSSRIGLVNSIKKLPEEKQKFLNTQLNKLDTAIEQLKSVNSVDSAMRVIGLYEPDKQMIPTWELILQKLVFYKMLKFGGVNQEFQSFVSSGKLSPKSLLTAVNIYDEVIKHHVINFNDDDSRVYWEDETIKLFLDKSKKFKKIRSVFESVGRAFQVDIASFNKEVLSTTTSIDAIPDKGLIGEMSGYISNVCYTEETSLLADWQVTPYKFVDRSKSPNEVIGTALMFDVKLESGEPAILIRAINIPDEINYDIKSLCEKYITVAEDVARKKGAKKVLIPGSTGSMSNYKMTINHLESTYCAEGQVAVSLAEEFKFNGYDLTHNCYVARTV